jgi:MFS family permease
MAWVPRFPDLKENLNLSNNNGAFGTLITTGAIGAIAGLLTVGQVVHKVGVYKVASFGTIYLFSLFIAIVHIHNNFYFAIANVALGFGVMILHISFTTQSFHAQQRSDYPVVTTASGFWSAGSLVTAILSGLLVGQMGLALHIDILSAICAVAILVILYRLKPVLVKPNLEPDKVYRVRDIFKSFHLDWPVSLGMAFAVYLEFAIVDWGTIFTKERLNIDSGLNAIPYIVFTIMMIVGRLSAKRILQRFVIEKITRLAAIFAGLSFGICISVATHLPSTAKWWSYTLFIVGFALAGIGSSILAPSFSSAANDRSPHPSAVVVGQFGMMNNVLTTILKYVVAGVIAATGSIALALMVPAILIVIASTFTYVLKKS